MRLIHLIDKEKVNLLCSLGFSYQKEIIGDKTTYCFFETPELMAELNSRYSAQDYFISKTINF